VRPPEYFKTWRGRALAITNLLTDEESAIKDLVAEKGLKDHFSFLPFTAETGEIYNALDIVTFPNQGVGLGRPVLEAATYGKPVVASGSESGAGVLLPGKTGLLLEDASPIALADALRLLVGDADLRQRLGAAAAEHAREKFDPAINAHAVERLYDQLLGLDSPAPAEEPQGAAVA
jgi:glycosyltransferase involved in cell wall biosynthesis